MNPNRLHQKTHFYKYMSASTCIKVLDTGKLRWTCPLVFNDPFDMQVELLTGFSIEELNVKLVEKWVDLIFSEEKPVFFFQTNASNIILLMWENKDNLNRSDVEKNLLSANSMSVESFEHRWGEVKDQLLQSAKESRVLCLAEKNDNLLMWSHYADSHTGVVAGIKCVEEDDSAWLAAQRVEYQEHFPTITVDEFIETSLGISEKKLEEIALRKFVTTKSRDWEYEKEWRVVSHLIDSSVSYEDWKILSSELESIYFGCNISEENKMDILNILRQKYPNTKVYQSNKASSRYMLQMTRI